MWETVSSAETITFYDTTLRDGAQSEDVLFSVEDKLRIAHYLDQVGLDYIEGGWPGANPKDGAFFEAVRKQPLMHGRLLAFGSTCRPGGKPEKDATLEGLLRAETGAITIFGKSWPLHVERALGISLEENLDLIHDSIRFLKGRVETVFFDAEHFFDGFKADQTYALKVLQAAREGGADTLVLCETNGGCLVEEVSRVTRQVADAIDGVPLGIHCHNDSGVAVANSLAAVSAGARQVQGTVNGIGERCGNADLITIIPNLQLKMGFLSGITDDRLRRLTGLSRFVDEMLNRPPRKNQPYVGQSAFAHKGGIHVSAVLKDSKTYEHIVPERVGNRQRVLVSEQSGRSNLMYRLAEYGIRKLDPRGPRVRKLLTEIKDLEHKGYQFDGADASFEIRARRILGEIPNYFELHGFRVIDERRVRGGGGKVMGAEATVKLKVAGRMVHLVGEGAGPVDALHVALSRALEWHYPGINDLKLVDYKVRILNGGGTGAKVRVLIEWRDEQRTWGTVGVSDHIIAASYDAMVEAVIYKLFKDGVPAAESGPRK